MGRAPCCEKKGLKRGPWTPDEDKLLVDYIQTHGHGSWRSLPKLAGLSRCGKSCRLRWTNYLRPDIKRGPFTPQEDRSIVQLHAVVGNRWSMIATQFPGRTDNEIKNYWNTHLKKRLQHHTAAGLKLDNDDGDSCAAPGPFTVARHMKQWETARLEAEARLAGECRLFSAQSTTATTTSSRSGATSTDLSIVENANGEAADFFLRIWNSEIGDAFRKSVVKTKAPAVAALHGRLDYSQTSSKELEDEMESCFRLFLRDDFAGEELGLTFHGKLGVFSLFPGDEASLDAALVR